MNRTTINTTLHFDLGFVSESAPVKLHVGTRRIPLLRHTPQTLANHRAGNAALRLIPDESVTHYAEDVELPQEYVQLLLVTAAPTVEGAKLDTLLLSTIHIPRSAREKVLEQRIASCHPCVTVPNPKLAQYGALVTLAEDPAPIIDVHDFKTAMDAAVSLVYHHVELVNIGATTGATVSNIIEYSNGISDLAMQILQQALLNQQDPSNQNWVYETPYLDTNLQPTTTNYYNWSDITKEWVTGPISDSVKKAKNEPSLQSSSTNAGVYTVQQGVTNVSVPQSATTPRTEVRALDDSSTYWTVNNLTPQHGFSQSGDLSFENNTFTISFTNSWCRWLSGYVEFYGADGSAVTPAGWQSQLPAALAGVYDTDTKKYVAIFSSVDTILAIPVGGEPTEISFTWPSNASSVKLMAGGIGRTGGIEGQDGVYYGAWDSNVCTGGAVMTGIFNFGIPTACLLMGAAVSLSGLNEIAKSAFTIILDVASTLIVGAVSTGIQGGGTTTLLIAFVDLIPRLLLDITDLAVWMSAEIAEGAAEEATPIFGWIAMAVSVLSTVALLVETSAEVALSPATFELTASRAIDAQWTLLPDINHQNTWPLEATSYEVVATYQDGTTRSTTGQMQSSPQTGPITVYFNAENSNRLPAGGNVTFTAKFFSDTGWLAGSAKSALLNADIPGTLLTVPQMNITENLVPLTSSTTYQFDQKLIYNANTQQHEWSNASGAPTATVQDLSSSNVGNNLAELTNITISQQTSELGYTWEASGQGLPLADQPGVFSGQMFTFQAIDVRSDPEDGLKFVPDGFTPKPLLLFDLDGPANGVGFNFWVDPRNGLYHVRQVVLDGTTNPFDLSIGQSWGRFNEQIDAAIIHPSGYVVGVSTANSKIEVLNLVNGVGADAVAPLANIYSGYGTRPGLIHIPLGVAATPNAGVIVLEAADSNLPGAGARLQAFDFLGNPAPIFAGSSPVAALKDEGTLPVTLLDIAIESKGYIYVLKYLNEGANVSDYRLDIYNPDGSWLNQTAGISSACLTVDLWRTVYTLNFEMIEKPSGGRTEPSVSIWLPSTPL
ncbi:MAG: hypothetical protein JWM21_2821 [Acidobacteria bacterium]|nr:hypothetical protein [Acidobacteriota bacterium]